MGKPLCPAGLRDVRVLTVPLVVLYRDVTGSPDEELASTVDGAVHVDTFHFPHEYLKSDLREMSWAHANLPTVYHRFGHSLPRRFFAPRPTGTPFLS